MRAIVLFLIAMKKKTKFYTQFTVHGFPGHVRYNFFVLQQTYIVLLNCILCS